ATARPHIHPPSLHDALPISGVGNPSKRPNTATKQAHGVKALWACFLEDTPMTVDRKLRLRLELIAALPEPILLDRLRRLSQAERSEEHTSELQSRVDLVCRL